MKKTKPLVKRQKQTGVGYILSPKIDFWMTGGVSVVVMLMVLLYTAIEGRDPSVSISSMIGSALLLHVLINWPHFLGAYSLLYRSKNSIKQYPSATIYVPIVLVLVVAFFVLASFDVVSFLPDDQDIAYFLWLIAAFYLAWHYTGQAWGMIATYSKLSDLVLKKQEVRVIRFGLRTLLVWHVIWGAQDLPVDWFGGYLSQVIPTLMAVINIVAVLSFFASLLVWYGVTLRAGKLPDSRILISWLSIYMWYLVLFFMPQAYLLVQAAHALQYLPFPLRVELNNLGEHVKKASLSHVMWGIRYYLILVVVGLVVFYSPEFISDMSQPFTLAIVISSAISIHHYFVDSCIWHISNKSVRGSLFAHLDSR